MLEIRRATTDDMDAVMTFYHAMIEEMKGTDFDILWKRDEHPSDAFLRESVEQGYLFGGFLDNGELATSLVIDRTAAPGYERVPWRVAGPGDEVGIMHAVATRPAHHGQGFARRLVTEALAMAAEDGVRAVHLDTLPYNTRGQSLYLSCGFENRGTHPIFYDDLGTIDLVMFEYVMP